MRELQDGRESAVEAASILREYGFDAATVWDEGLSGANDEVIAAKVFEEDRVLVTLDLDFANIQAYPPNEHRGIIVMRLDHQDVATVIAYVRRIAGAVQQRSPQGELWIVEERRIRFRSRT